ncbi:ATP-dependent RecD-like DNA helicase [subsurface metagenome]
MLDELEGHIESITYTNEENGYTIARVKAQGIDKPVTVIGNLVSPTPGETIRMKGEWSRHPKYGRQFKIVSYQSSVPAAVEGIEKYLGSGLIKGIGPEMAKRIVQRFGEKTLSVIENEAEKLTQVEGIGKKRIEMIRAAWDEQKEIRGVMIFLRSHDVSPGYAAKIFRQYGNHSIEVVTENPYRLAEDIFGIGFLTADRIAANMGFARDSEERAEAGILHVLSQCVDEGHVCYPSVPLLQKCQKILQIDREIIARNLDRLIRNEKLILDQLQGLPEGEKALYLPPYYVSETGIAANLAGLQEHPKGIRQIDSERALQWVQQRLDITLAENQVKAIENALENKLLVVTGGPGTGKTTIMKAILAILSRVGTRIMLAAPTGRAAKRLSEAAGYEAKTIHRLLEYNLRAGGFRKNQHDPLQCNLLIVDEASMIDTVLMHHLLKAVPPQASLILVGDVNQLPSVGAGNVLKDIIASGRVPVVELNEIFRQAKESQIVVNAHRINLGIAPSFEPSSQESDFYFIKQEDPEKVVEIILELARERIPRRFHLDPVDDIQVLTPMHRGAVGVENLNRVLQDALNPGQNGIPRGNKVFKDHDKVMQIRNNYQKDVFNGDIGRITAVQTETRKVTVCFDGREVGYEFGELDQIALAYAVSVHKAQGCEFPAVVIPIMTQHYMLLQRNLLYTAVTRGKQLVVLVGTGKALHIAVKNDKTRHRYTLLRERLIAP